MATFEFKRKIYDELVAWNKENDKLPLIVDGLRQVGKSFIVSKFAHDHYKHVAVYDFRYRTELRGIFEGNIDVDSIIRKSSLFFPSDTFVPNKTILVFEEINDCPLARTALKSFALDKRFTVIATGSLLGVHNYRRKNKVEVPTGYEKIIQMKSMDFEEFLWANGLNDDSVSILKERLREKKELPPALADYFEEMINRYVVIGGMPQSVKEFLKTNNYLKSRECLIGLLNDYRADFGRFINEKGEEEVDYYLQAKLNKIFTSVPLQLTREKDTSKFKYSEVKKGGRASEFEDAFEWLEKAGLIDRCFNLKAIEKPIEANTDETYFKAFISDIGLLMASYPLSVSQDFLRGELGSRKGAIYENLAATMIDKAGFPLRYYSRGDEHLEIDFIIESDDGINLIEEKATNGKMAASRAVMEGRTAYKASKCYKIIKDNFGEGSFYESIPHAALPFLLEEKKKKMEEGIDLSPLSFPPSTNN